MGRYVYYFEPGDADGSAAMKRFLGAKGAGLAEMARLGLSVPPGLTIATEACTHFLRHEKHVAGLKSEVCDAIARIEAFTETGWGHGQLPLLLSVRASAPAPMYGAMGTVLNLGMNAEVTAALARHSGDEEFAFSCRRRMIQNYARVVFGITDPQWQIPLEERELSTQEWKTVIAEMEKTLRSQTGASIPDDPDEQLWHTIEAIFRSWNSSKVQAHRRLHGIGSASGTGVTLMAMVFGNRDSQSASGVAFTRNPTTGEDASYGEFLPSAQGEDVAIGRHSPQPMRSTDEEELKGRSLQELFPSVYHELRDVLQRLEVHFRHMLEVEFVIESGRLWLLQTRNAVVTGRAAVRTALDMVDEQLIDKEEAVLRVDPIRHVPDLLVQRVNRSEDCPPVAFRGKPASPGVAVGRVVTSMGEANARKRRGESVVLVQSSMDLKDVDTLRFVDAIVLTSGGLTTHAVQIIRQLDLPCVCGVQTIEFADDGSGIYSGNRHIPRGELVTVDGTSGEIFIGAVPLVDGPHDDADLVRFIDIADRFRRMDVRVTAESLDEIEYDLGVGADGIGLWRTENSIVADRDRMMAIRRALLFGDQQTNEEAMHQLLRFHRRDVARLLRAANGRPVTVRLLDAPLSQFLPDDDPDLTETAQALKMEIDEVRRRVDALRESESMVGLRGGRLAIVQPSIYAMQVRAVVEAARIVVDDGIVPVVEILIPRVAAGGEANWIVDEVQATIAEHLHGATEQITFEIGAVIQLPRAALVCDEIAHNLDFIVLATRELTRFSWGMSPAGSGRFMRPYVQKGLISHDPFQSLDQYGVGELVRIAIERGRIGGGELVVGVVDGHASDPRSVRFFESLDVDQLTVDPGEVAATKIAAAQAYIGYERILRKRTHPGSGTSDL